jgi:hypothetical protein
VRLQVDTIATSSTGSRSRPERLQRRRQLLRREREPAAQIERRGRVVEPQGSTRAVDALHARGLLDRRRDQRHHAAPAGIDWVCVSPKADAPGGADHAARS